MHKYLFPIDMQGIMGRIVAKRVDSLQITNLILISSSTTVHTKKLVIRLKTVVGLHEEKWNWQLCTILDISLGTLADKKLKKSPKANLLPMLPYRIVLNVFDAIYNMTFYILSRQNILNKSFSIYMIERNGLEFNLQKSGVCLIGFFPSAYFIW